MPTSTYLNPHQARKTTRFCFIYLYQIEVPTRLSQRRAFFDSPSLHSVGAFCMWNFSPAEKHPIEAAVVKLRKRRPAGFHT
jgi:hypothetical protein